MIISDRNRLQMIFARSVIVAVACMALSTAANGQTTFKIATVAPDGSHWMNAMRDGASVIDARTSGRVKFRFYTGGIQGNTAQVQRKMRIGQLHGGAFTAGALKHFHRNAELYSMPLLFNSFEEVAFVRDRMDQKLRDMLEAAGYVNFGYTGGGFAYLMSSQPITSRKDMDGLKIWIPEGDLVARTATETLGIAPVTLPLTDVLTGLQTDLLDTVMAPPIGAIVLQWHTAVGSITNVPIAYTFGMLVIDGKYFERLSAADQQVVREVMEAVYQGFDEKSVEDDRVSLQALLDDGLRLVEVDPGEVENWRRLMRDSNRKAGKAGAFDLALLDEAECYLEVFRNGGDAGQCAP